MNKVRFGNTGLMVSRLNVGTGTVGGKGQRRNTPAEFARVLERGVELGVNFWDTSDDYGTEPYLREALRQVPRRDVVIATKTSDRGSGAADSLKRSLEALGTDYVDILYLHYISPSQLRGAGAALEALHHAKAEGLVRAVGISTHYIECVRMATEMPEVEAVLSMVDMSGSFIDDGSMDGMADALKRCYEAGKGVCGMKALAEGKLADRVREAIGYAVRFTWAHSISVGITSMSELEDDVALFEELEEGKG